MYGVAWRKAAPVVALLPGLAVVAPAASAAPDQQSMFMEDNLLLYRGEQTSDTTLQQLKSLGVDAIRVSVHWRAIAPGHRSARKPSSLNDETDPADYPADTTPTTTCCATPGGWTSACSSTSRAAPRCGPRDGSAGTSRR